MTCNYLNKARSVIILNGNIPNLEFTDKIIIAADGAAHKLNITPHYVIGDMDSSSNFDLNSKYIKIDDQNSTDFEKCLNFVTKNNLTPTLIIGMSGGEIDHALNNIYSFMKYSKNNEIYFLDEDENNKLKFGIALKNIMNFEVKTNAKISIMPFPEAIISSYGLKWELNKTKLSLEYTSSRNFAVKEDIELTLISGQALAIISIS